MLHRTATAATAAAVTVVGAAAALLTLGALPAAAATSTIRTFSIPGVYGIGAWGSYQRAGQKTRITVCVKDTARGVYGGAAAGVAFDGGRRQAVSAVVIGFRHTSCRTMTTGYTDHLVVAALSGWPNRTVRQRGHVRQVY
jgi:hypothetical protein